MKTILFALGVALGTIHLMWMKIIRLWTKGNTQLIVTNVTMISHTKLMYLLRFRQGDYNAKSDL
ncbi:hypothetical protein HO927_09900 [Streptococcus suis]|nr:hypothetical protein [Streptococcus suis]NQP39307.1 hypothetical protein [Streptococcus suis]